RPHVRSGRIQGWLRHPRPGSQPYSRRTIQETAGSHGVDPCEDPIQTFVLPRNCVSAGRVAARDRGGYNTRGGRTTAGIPAARGPHRRRDTGATTTTAAEVAARYSAVSRGSR